MRTVSLVALAAMLMSAASPALAQKKKKGKEPEQQLMVADEFRRSAAMAETAFRAGNWGAADQAITAAEPFARSDEERHFVNLVRFETQQRLNSSEGVIKATDALMASPKTNPAELPRLNFLRGRAAFNLKKWREALPYLEKAREIGDTDPDITLLIAQTYFNLNNPARGIAEMTRAIDDAKAKGEKPAEDWYLFVISKTHAARNRAATGQWMARHLRDYPSAANWRRNAMVLAESYENVPSRDARQRLDLMRLVRAGGALAGEQDYFDYAKLSAEAGMPWETAAVIAEGRTAGKVPTAASDFSPLLTAAQAGIKTKGSADALAKKANSATGTGAAAAAAGDAYLAGGNAAKAIELYDLALTKGGANADEVNLHRGIALAKAGRKDEARTAFAAVTAGPLTDIALLWTASLDAPTVPAA
jgi:tetratricopeptide (TPR) repeat protein